MASVSLLKDPKGRPGPSVSQCAGLFSHRAARFSCKSVKPKPQLCARCVCTVPRSRSFLSSSHGRQLSCPKPSKLVTVCGRSGNVPWQHNLAHKPAAKASILTGLYITIVGLALMVAPAKVFGILFDSSMVAKGWIQVGGVLATLFGIYYLGAGIGDCLDIGVQGFYVSTVLGRMVLSLIFAWLAGTKALPQAILILAGINLAGAMSMYRALMLSKS